MPRQHAAVKLLAALILGVGPAGSRANGPPEPDLGRALERPATPAPKAADDLKDLTYLAGKPELARAYLVLEKLAVTKAAAIDVPTLERINKGMDLATNYYFAGDTRGTIGLVVEQLAAIDTSWAGVAPRLTLRLDRAVARVDRPEITARLGVACPLPPGAPRVLDVDVVALPPRALDGAPVPGARPQVVGSVRGWDLRIASTVATTLRLPWTTECTGELALRVVTPSGVPDEARVGHAALTRVSLDERRDALAAQLDAVPADAAKKLARAVVACRARVGTLTDAADPDTTLNLLCNPAERLHAIEAEVASIEKDADPYARAVGDRWLALGATPPGLPVRLYVPPRDKTLDPNAPYPLVIALHGAGGDEHLWMTGYGGGNLKDALDAHGAIGVSPQVGLGTFGPDTMDAIIEGVAHWYPVDRSRVYVIGHSLGGGAAVAWARLRPGTLAAACSVAGVGTLTGTPKLPPILSIAAQFDTLCTPKRLKADAAKAKAAGLPVEYREVPHYGHVLVLGKVTREAVDWLMTHRREAPSPGLPGPATPASSPGKPVAE